MISVRKILKLIKTFKELGNLKDLRLAKDIFMQAQIDYPEYFNDVKFRIALFKETVFDVYEDGSIRVTLSILSTVEAKLMTPEFYEKFDKLAKAINPRYKYIHQSLLHELGHCLDYLKDSELFAIKVEDYRESVKRLQYLRDELNWNDEEIIKLYARLQLEKTADIYSIMIGMKLL